MGILIQTPLIIGPETVGAAEMTSGNASSGDVLTANGAGGAAWQAPQPPPAPPTVRMRCTGTTPDLNVKTAAAETIPIDFGDLTTGELVTALNSGEYVASGSWTFPDSGPRIVTLSNATALTYLDCSNNGLTALDVTEATALTVLKSNRGVLTALDVSGMTALVTLECSGNTLTSPAVDAVLVTLAAMTTANGMCNLTGNAEPTATGLAAKATLEGRGWQVDVTMPK